MLKSSPISLYEVIIPKENQWNLLNSLLLSKKIMIPTDNNHERIDTHKLTKLKKIEELEIMINFFKNTLEDLKWPISEPKISLLEQYYQEISSQNNKSQLNDLEENINNINQLLSQNKNNLDLIIKNRIILYEKLVCFYNLEKFIPELLNDFTNYDSHVSNSKQITYLIGTIPNSNIENFSKLFFRISRNNFLIKFFPLDLNLNEDFLINYLDRIEEKNLFIILFPFGDDKKMITYKKIIETMNGNFLKIENDSNFKEEIKLKIINDLKDNEDLFKKTKESINTSLLKLSEINNLENISYVSELELILKKEKKIINGSRYIKEIDDNLVCLKFWILNQNIDFVEKIINELEVSNDNFTKPKLFKVYDENEIKKYVKPSYHLTLESDFTSIFQIIVDTYGIPNYEEINPGFFTIISFSALFGIMFGDIGHGSLIFFFSLFLFTLKKTEPLYKGRYLFLLLGIYSTFSGLIYNEFFSVPLPFFKSQYSLHHGKVFKDKTVYPFGFDWFWFTSENEVGFFNSFKMKFSIVIGVIHMILGIFLKGINCINKKSKLDFFCEFIPQLLFMTCLFGYMVFCIIYKWLINWDNAKNIPSIITVFINIISVEKNTSLYDYKLQQTIQIILVLIALVSVIVMIVPKPLIIFLQKKPKISEIKENEDESYNEELIEKEKLEVSHDNEPIGEVIVHQLIETIEFVLGSISNTASYLRLWALSLAHGQLSKVFLDLIFSSAYKNMNSIFSSTICIIIFFPFFMAVTFAVLLCMDLMECFLHTLRLHWVEFQNKFYKGNGIRYEPFQIENI